MLHSVTSALADGGPVAQGIIVFGLLLALVQAVLAAVRPSRRWGVGLAVLPYAVLVGAVWFASRTTGADVADALAHYTRATWPVRLQAGLHSQAGLAVAGALGMAGVALVGGTVCSIATLLRSKQGTPLHAILPVAGVGGFVAVVPEHLALVLIGSVVALWGLVGTMRSGPAHHRGVLAVHATAAMAAAAGLCHAVSVHHRVVGGAHDPVGGVGIGVALVGFVVPLALARPGRPVFVAAAVATVLAGGLGWLGAWIPSRAATTLLPEQTQLAVRDRLGVLLNHSVRPPMVSAGAPLGERDLVAVTPDLVLNGEQVVAYRGEATEEALTQAMATQPRVLAIDAHETWQALVPILAAVADRRGGIDVVVQCRQAVLCTVPVQLDASGMAVPDEMRWAEVLERHGGTSGLVLRPAVEP